MQQSEETSTSEASSAGSNTSSDSDDVEDVKQEQSMPVIEDSETAAVNNINSYAVPARKLITSRPVKPKSSNWTDGTPKQADKPCQTYVILGTCNKGDCPYNHTPKLRELAIDKLIKERATQGSSTTAAVLHNMNLYHKVMDRHPTEEEYGEFEELCLSHSETSADVEE